jgi:hypothetical protein
MAKRHEHLFQFTGAIIAAAAQAEYAYHKDRLQYWNIAMGLAIESAKNAGLKVEEYAVTGGKRVQMVVDPSIQGRLNECGAKIDKHRTAADHFQIEASTYVTQSERSYELQPDDVIYFRLAGNPRED